MHTYRCCYQGLQGMHIDDVTDGYKVHSHRCCYVRLKGTHTQKLLPRVTTYKVHIHTLLPSVTKYTYGNDIIIYVYLSILSELF